MTRAGTGKTLLALDFARRRAEQGAKVLYLTFNKNLANHIKDQIGTTTSLKVINIHALFGEYVTVDAEKVRQEPRKYFSDLLPEQFLDYVSGLADEERRAMQYDLLVMDEGQDILKPSYLYSLDMLLKGGFENGDWAIFYDEKQNIYNPEYADGMELIAGYSCTKFKLFVNCRNTVQIGTYSSEASGVEIGEFLKENGEEVQRISYSGKEDFKKQVKDIMKRLRAERVTASDVVFLAPKKYRNSLLSDTGFEVNELGDSYDPKSALPKFSTIQGYKGLDSKVAVLVDVEDIHAESFSKLIYIAGTRARTLLYIVASEEYWERQEA